MIFGKALNCIYKIFVISVFFINLISCKMEKKIVDGYPARISQFPHSVFLRIQYRHEAASICGSSILNQRILITAGHCVDRCNLRAGDDVDAFAGAADYTSTSAVLRKVDLIKIHPRYDEQTVKNDIALLRVSKNFPLNSEIRRLAISSRFPSAKSGKVAGWGIINEKQEKGTKILMSTSQYLRPRHACSRIFLFSDGMFCAGYDNKPPHPSSGDSGSAMVTPDYVQQGMGLVSFKIRRYPTLVVYTNISYHYKWIADNAKALYCSKQSYG